MSHVAHRASIFLLHHHGNASDAVGTVTPPSSPPPALTPSHTPTSGKKIADDTAAADNETAPAASPRVCHHNVDNVFKIQLQKIDLACGAEITGKS
uniref:Uncharacterized protein n=1 Tax=Knipowitschia caucasica TaxID=637954 RepID=A0AAV2L7A8_KNICA